MRRIMLRVAYDGTNYHGWQVQPGAATIEGELNKAISALTGEEVQVIGASRTDAGVHALGNVAVFDTWSRIPAEKFSCALNQRLPEDIAVQQSEEVAPDFHPRHCDCHKTYEYTILNRRFPLPEYRNTAYFYYGRLDVEAMQRGAAAFVGEHDFAGFCSMGTQVQSTVRRIYSMTVEQQGELIRLQVQGNGFLYNMVRAMVGTCIYAAEGKLDPAEIPAILESRNRTLAGPTAPPDGLYMTNLWYHENVL